MSAEQVKQIRAEVWDMVKNGRKYGCLDCACPRCGDLVFFREAVTVENQPQLIEIFCDCENCAFEIVL